MLTHIIVGRLHTKDITESYCLLNTVVNAQHLNTVRNCCQSSHDDVILLPAKSSVSYNEDRSWTVIQWDVNINWPTPSTKPDVTPPSFWRTKCVFLFFSFLPSLPFHVLHFSLAGHKCLIRCLAVHINEKRTAGCFLKELLAASPQQARERERPKRLIGGSSKRSGRTELHNQR